MEPLRAGGPRQVQAQSREPRTPSGSKAALLEVIQFVPDRRYIRRRWARLSESDGVFPRPVLRPPIGIATDNTRRRCRRGRPERRRPPKSPPRAVAAPLLPRNGSAW